jgi:hypothetical protein
MTKGFIQDDVLRFIYKETKEEENQTIKYNLLINSQLMDFYMETIETISEVNALQLEPSESSVKRILDYSNSYSLESIS